MREILITKHRSREQSLNELDEIISERFNNCLDELTYKSATECIKSYFDRLDTLANSGTTVDIRKTFNTQGKQLTIRLKHPAPSGILSRIAVLLRRP